MTHRAPIRARSWLFTPATRPERFAKAAERSDDLRLPPLGVGRRSAPAGRAAVTRHTVLPGPVIIVAGCLLQAMSAMAQPPPARIGDIYGWQNHQPTEAELAKRGGLPDPAQARAQADEEDRLGRKLMDAERRDGILPAK